MRYKKIKLAGLLSFTLLGLASFANANEVLLTSNTPLQISFRTAHKSLTGPVEYGPLQTVSVNNNAKVTTDLKTDALTGLVIVSVNEHVLPPNVTQFNVPQQCAMTTDKTKSTGTLAFELGPHKLTCRSYGGVFS